MNRQNHYLRLHSCRCHDSGWRCLISLLSCVDCGAGDAHLKNHLKDIGDFARALPIDGRGSVLRILPVPLVANFGPQTSLIVCARGNTKVGEVISVHGVCLLFPRCLPCRGAGSVSWEPPPRCTWLKRHYAPLQ